MCLHASIRACGRLSTIVLQVTTNSYTIGSEACKQYDIVEYGEDIWAGFNLH